MGVTEKNTCFFFVFRGWNPLSLYVFIASWSQNFISGANELLLVNQWYTCLQEEVFLFLARFAWICCCFLGDTLAYPNFWSSFDVKKHPNLRWRVVELLILAKQIRFPPVICASLLPPSLDRFILLEVLLEQVWLKYLYLKIGWILLQWMASLSDFPLNAVNGSDIPLTIW